MVVACVVRPISNAHPRARAARTQEGGAPTTTCPVDEAAIFGHVDPAVRLATAVAIQGGL